MIVAILTGVAEVVDTGILDVYAKCGWLNYAKRILRFTSFKNEITRSAMIGAYVTYDYTQGLGMFEHMRMEDTESPSPVIRATIIRACAKLNDMRRGRKMNGYTVKLGSNLDLMLVHIWVCNALIDFYSKCGKIGIARIVFNKMNKRDDVSRNTMITGYRVHSHGKEAISLINEMQSAGLDSRSNPFKEGEDDTSQMATLDFDDIIRSQYTGHQALVIFRTRDPTWRGQFEYTKEQSHA
ncbi:hypothetical protein CQW23_23459 [Capsicum baccatum]|uniref:Pentatricopeptide repeat-containing protein n=1 Tax=Capsicum baccatum TaxID=33114 RepID=A0A2G2VRZ2_CAPBA|nr:hypothetical protein CQW23_23459 [Capsicum baccatum]